MFVHRSNRLEALADALARVVEAPLASPLASEIIVVASQGIERWVSEELARRFGVWANARFPFPRAFMDELLGVGNAYEREALTFTIAELLPEIAREPSGRAVARFLDGDDRGVKCFELSERLARVFDQYFVYRPDLVRAWKEGRGRGFQPELLRRAILRLGESDIGARAARFFAGPIPESVPERISVFGVSALPPIYVKILAHVSRERRVHVFLLRPSPGGSPGHPLAQSLGAAGTEFENLLRSAHADVRLVDAFVEPGRATLLRTIQSDVLAAIPRTASGPTTIGAPAAETSVVVHSCHSALREVEVLRDQLLACFESDETLEPHHVVVMTPKLEAYAPLIEAVLGGDPLAPGFIPYRIFDREPSSASTVAELFFRLLDLAGSRLKASAVLDLFDLDPVQERFGIGPEHLFELRRLVASSGIRWGADETHRTKFGQPPRVENTFRFGLRRLLLGHAMPSSLGRPFHGVLPLETEEETGVLVAKISRAFRSIEVFDRTLAAGRTAREWATVLPSLLETFVSPDGAYGHELRGVVEAIGRLAEYAERGGFQGKIHREALGDLMRTELDGDRPARHSLSGKVTISALLPMRSIPFRVVYLLGMSDVNFPRRSRTPWFDLVARHPEPGDRSPRSEDRLLFLEALLSARDRFVVSYVGKAVQDNAPFPPSVVVAELIEALGENPSGATKSSEQLALPFAERPAQKSPGRAAVVEHPLKPWGARYFRGEDPRLVSFTEADAEGATALASHTGVRRRFHVAPLLSEPKSVVSIDELARFFENPSRGLLERRLGLSLYDEPLLIEDREPLELVGLDGYEVGRTLFSRLLERGPFTSAAEWARAMGLVPEGTLGDVDFTRLFADVQALAVRARRWRDAEPLPPVEIDVELPAGTVRGFLHDIFPRGQIGFRYVRLKAKAELSAWVRHLALQTAPDGTPRTTVLGGRKMEGRGVEARTFSPLDASVARAHLSELLGLYHLGQKAPLCLFPDASKQFVSKWIDASKKPDRQYLAFLEAKRAFGVKRGRPDARGVEPEGEDPYVHRLFNAVDPFASRAPFDDDGALGLPNFADLARTAFEPLLTHSTLEHE